MSDLMDGLAELEEVREDYEQAEEYYENNKLELFVSPRLRRALSASEITFRVRLAAIPVDAVAERLEISSVTVPGNSEATALIERIWDENGLLLEAPSIHLNASMFGDCYVVVWEAEEGETVDIMYNSPLNMRVIYDSENPNVKKFAVKEWAVESPDETIKDYRRANLYYADRIERYATKPETKGDKETDWLPYADDDEDFEFSEGEDGSIVDNPYGVIPVFHFRNSAPYGKPEHVKAYGPQDAVNKLVVTHMATVDYQGFPQRYALEDPQVPSEDAADFGDDDADADEGSGSQSTLTTGPGELWWLKGLRGVGQFATADPDVFLKPLDRFVRLMASVTNTPLHYFDPMGDSPSGEALRAKEAPLVKRIINRRQAYATTWREVFTFALIVKNVTVEKVDVRWTSPASLDDLDGWRTAEIKLKMGVPAKQLLLEAGYTETQVTEWLADKVIQPPREGEEDKTETEKEPTREGDE
jgi:hypothetical protein